MRLSEAERWAEAAAAWRALVCPGAGLPAHLRVHAHCALGDALLRLGEDEAGAAAFSNALAVDPAFAPAALRLGGALRRLGRLAAATAAYRRVFRRRAGGGRRRASRAELALAARGAAVALLRLGTPSRARRLLRAWAAVDRSPGRDCGALALLAAATRLCLGRWPHRHASGSDSRPSAEDDAAGPEEALHFAREAAASAGPELVPLCQHLVHRLKSAPGAPTAIDLEDTAALLGLAAANRSALDAPQWVLVDDKCWLHGLLREAEDPRRARLYWPEGHALPEDLPAALAALRPSSDGDEASAASSGRWWLKAARGHGGHGSQLLGPWEAAVEAETLCRAEGTARALLQRDVENCVLLDGRRFTLRLYLIVVEGPPRRAFLAREGLVYQALEGSEVTNCSQAALHTRGSARAAGAPAAKDLRWLRKALDEHLQVGHGGYEVLWRRLTRLAALVAAGPAAEALASRVGEVSDASAMAVLGLPKILGLDVILAAGPPGEGPEGHGVAGGGGGPWPWLLEVNRFPALGFRAPSDAAVKLPVVRDAWRLAWASAAEVPAGMADRAPAAAAAAGRWTPALGCLEELPTVRRPRRQRR